MEIQEVEKKEILNFCPNKIIEVPEGFSVIVKMPIDNQQHLNASSSIHLCLFDIQKIPKQEEIHKSELNMDQHINNSQTNSETKKSEFNENVENEICSQIQNNTICDPNADTASQSRKFQLKPKNQNQKHRFKGGKKRHKKKRSKKRSKAQRHKKNLFEFLNRPITDDIEQFSDNNVSESNYSDHTKQSTESSSSSENECQSNSDSDSNGDFSLKYNSARKKIKFSQQEAGSDEEFVLNDKNNQNANANNDDLTVQPRKSQRIHELSQVSNNWIYGKQSGKIMKCLKRTFCSNNQNKTFIDQIQNCNANQDKCAICLNDIQCPTGYLEACNHIFCYDCLKQWSGVTNKCPLCKTQFKQIIKKGDENSQNGIQIIKIRKRDQITEEDLQIMIADQADNECYVCENSNYSHLMMICDSCHFYCCHISCCVPKLDEIPEEDWHCKYCILQNERDGRDMMQQQRRKRKASTNENQADAIKQFITVDESSNSCANSNASIQFQSFSSKRETRSQKEVKQVLQERNCKNDKNQMQSQNTQLCTTRNSAFKNL